MKKAWHNLCTILIHGKDIGVILYSYGALVSLVCLLGFATGNMPDLDKDWVAAVGSGIAVILFLARAWYGLWESYTEWREKRKARTDTTTV